MVNGGGGVAASVIHGGTAPKGMNVERHSTTVLWRERDRKRGEREEGPMVIRGEREDIEVREKTRREGNFVLVSAITRLLLLKIIATFN